MSGTVDIYKQTTSEEYYVERHYLFVNSLDRDISLYPKSTEFKIQLPIEYREVSSIELVAGTIPNLDNVNTDPYLLLDVSTESTKLNHIKSTNSQDYFSALALHKGHSDNFYNLDRSSAVIMPHRFNSPKQRLNTLDIKLYHANGTSLSFGTAGSLVKTDQTSFTFEIKINMIKRKMFDTNFRGVFGDCGP